MRPPISPSGIPVYFSSIRAHTRQSAHLGVPNSSLLKPPPQAAEMRFGLATLTAYLLSRSYSNIEILMTTQLDSLKTVSVQEAADAAGFKRTENFLLHYQGAGFRCIRLSPRKRRVLVCELAQFISKKENHVA